MTAATTRLYYHDSYTTAFDADVLDSIERGGRRALILDRTYFYPTSGGQPCDTGRLDDLEVVDVAAEDGVVLHFVQGDGAVQPGQSVAGAIAWPRRYDHMQQHSGQHLLSQVFYRLFGYETVSVHFGEADSTLDLDAAQVTAEQVAAAEAEANRLAYAALPILAYEVDEAGLAQIPLRRPPKVSGKIRIVEIKEYDYSACGGTHVHSTAEIAPLKIVRQERRRDQTRLTFLCGLRAVEDYAAKHRLLNEAAALFSNEARAVPGLVQRALDQNRDLQRQVDALTEQLIRYEAGPLRENAPVVNGARVVQAVYSERSVDALKQQAALLREQPQTLALLATTAGGKLSLVFTRSADLTVHMGNLLRAALQPFGGNGGGRPDYAQGGGLDPEAAARVLEEARRLVEGE